MKTLTSLLVTGIVLSTGTLAVAAPARVSAVVTAIRRTNSREGGKVKISYPLVKVPKNAAATAKIESVLKSKTLPAELGMDGNYDTLSFKVNYNARAVLDLDILRKTGGPSPQVSKTHYVFDLNTGDQLEPKTIFLPASMASLAAQLDKRLQEAIKKGRTKCSDMESSAVFGTKHLESFQVSAAGLTFDCTSEFPPEHQGCVEARFLVRWAELRPHLVDTTALGAHAR